MDLSFWKGRRVLITGHTGFKGSWMALWLTNLGAEVTGISLPNDVTRSFFNACQLERLVAKSAMVDIRDYDALQAVVSDADPELVFHMAAQALVKDSYADPLGTYATNVMGTANLLHSLRFCDKLKAAVIITTDKCYHNNEWIWAYREIDQLGGFDPYSNSKACAELVVSSFTDSFLREKNIGVATARAGNVIGGGDWSKNRLIPDLINGILNRETILIRSPGAVRPWQHVLEPVTGYLKLAQALYSHPDETDRNWNFGPNFTDEKEVGWIAEYLSAKVEGAKWMMDKGHHPHEANVLRLDSSRARSILNWTPRWDLPQALDATFSWYMEQSLGGDMQKYSLQQINAYQELLGDDE